MIFALNAIKRTSLRPRYGGVSRETASGHRPLMRRGDQQDSAGGRIVRRPDSGRVSMCVILLRRTVKTAGVSRVLRCISQPYAAWAHRGVRCERPAAARVGGVPHVSRETRGNHRGFLAPAIPLRWGGIALVAFHVKHLASMRVFRSGMAPWKGPMDSNRAPVVSRETTHTPWSWCFSLFRCRA